MDKYLSALEEELRVLVTSPSSLYDPYYGIFQYHLGWVDENLKQARVDTGKRLRPLMCLLSCEAVGGDWHPALPVAAAIELAHNFSLIHDDIEDQSDKRRGRTAVWKVWGLAQGLNAGDGMFVLARLALDRLCERGLSEAKTCAVSFLFDRATLALCQGQFLDLGFESRLDVSVDEYLAMIRGKTAALISAATHMGALLATDDERIGDAFAEFGEKCGLAFQVVDDILGIWGKPEVTGKSAATDILTKKKSLPVIYGLEHSPALYDIYRQERITMDQVPRVLALLDEVKAREFSQRQADEYRSAALAALASTKISNRATEQLRTIAEAMTNRNR